MKTKRCKPSVRKDEVITAALDLASRTHFDKLSQRTVADHVGIKGPAVQYHFGTMTQLKNEVVRAAIKRRVLRVVAQAIVAGHPQARKIDDELKRAAFEGFFF